MDVHLLVWVAGTIIISITGLAAETISPENNCGINDVDKALECVGLPSLFINVSDYNAVVRQACRANRSQEVEDCIIWLETFHGCQTHQMFQLLVQTDRYLNMLDYFCSHSEVYVNNGPCIAQAQAPALNCSAQAIEDLSDVDEGGLTLGEILDELCRPLIIATSCFSDAVSTLCSSEAADFAKTLLESQFHYCYFENTSSVSTQQENTTMLRLHLSTTQQALFNKASRDSSNGTDGISHFTSVMMNFIMFICGVYINLE